MGKLTSVCEAHKRHGADLITNISKSHRWEGQGPSPGGENTAFQSCHQVDFDYIRPLTTLSILYFHSPTNKTLTELSPGSGNPAGKEGLCTSARPLSTGCTWAGPCREQTLEPRGSARSARPAGPSVNYRWACTRPRPGPPSQASLSRAHGAVL